MRPPHLSSICIALVLLGGTPASALADIGSHRPFAALFAGRGVEGFVVPPTPEHLRWLLAPVDAPGVPQTEVHPTPPHTGFKALALDTWEDFKAFPMRRSTWVILGIGAASAALGHPQDAELNNRLTGSNAVGNFFKPGKWIGSAHVEVAAALGLYAIGRYVVAPNEDGSRTNKLSHMGFDLLRAQLLSQALVHSMKVAVRRDRPTGECCSFPSGHAATAFAAASVLERHFAYRAAWPTLVIASYVAMSRLHDNRHYLSDVLFGSAVGVATGWTIVGRHGKNEYAVAPTPLRGGMAVNLTRTFAP